MRKLRLFFLFCILFIVMLACFGCAKRKPRPLLSPEDIQKELEADNATADDAPEVTPVITGDNFNIYSVNYYTVNVVTNSVMRATGMVNEGTVLTPELMVDFLIDSLSDESVSLGIESVELQDGMCVISFDDSISAIASSNDKLEAAILDAAAQSILDNVENCDSIIYRINGKAYKTVNNSFDLDYIYMDN